jgi:hypothetical protein
MYESVPSRASLNVNRQNPVRWLLSDLNFGLMPLESALVPCNSQVPANTPSIDTPKAVKARVFIFMRSNLGVAWWFFGAVGSMHSPVTAQEETMMGKCTVHELVIKPEEDSRALPNARNRANVLKSPPMLPALIGLPAPKSKQRWPMEGNVQYLRSECNGRLRSSASAGVDRFSPSLPLPNTGLSTFIPLDSQQLRVSTSCSHSLWK